MAMKGWIQNLPGQLLWTPGQVQYKAVVLKLFHVEDPQIDTYQPADPQLKRYDGDAHILDYYSSNSDFQPLSF